MANYRITNANKSAIVERLERARVAYWQIAEALGVHENTVSKWMRAPSDEQAQKIMGAVDEITGKRA